MHALRAGVAERCRRGDVRAELTGDRWPRCAPRDAFVLAWALNTTEWTTWVFEDNHAVLGMTEWIILIQQNL